MMNLTGRNIRVGAVMTGFVGMGILLFSCASPRHSTGAGTGGAGQGSGSSLADVPDGYADSLFVAAVQAKQAGRTGDASDLFTAFVRLKPRSPAGYYELALLKGAAGDAAGTLANARVAASLSPHNPWYGILYGNALAMNKTFDSAAGVFHQLAARYPLENRYLYNEAVMLSDAKSYAASLALFDTLENRLGITEEFVFQKQRIFLKLGEPDSAAAEIRRLISTDPDNARYYGLLAQVYADDNRPDKAIGVYASLLQRDPDNPQAMVATGLFYKKQGNDSAFRRYMHQAFSNPGFSVEDKINFMYPYLKYVEVDTTQRTEALALCRMILDAHPRNARALALSGDMFLQSEMPDSAMDAYRASMAVSDTLYEVWNQMMLVFASRNQRDSLLRMSGAAVRRFPRRAEAWYYRGVSLFSTGAQERSTDAFRRALSLPIADKHLKVQIYSTLGEAYQDLGRYRFSDSCFRTALALSPEDDRVLNNYSFHLAERSQDLPQALKMISEAVRIRPGESTYEDTYAWVLYKMGRYAEAKVWMEKALGDPGTADHPGYLDHYGDILYKNEDRQGAITHWKLARERGDTTRLLQWKISRGKLPGPRIKEKLSGTKPTIH